MRDDAVVDVRIALVRVSGYSRAHTRTHVRAGDNAFTSARVRADTLTHLR